MDTAKQEKKLLNIDDLNQITGGKNDTNPQSLPTKELDCPTCKVKKLFYLCGSGRAVCETCHNQIQY